MNTRRHSFSKFTGILLIAVGMLMASGAQAGSFAINVVDQDGAAVNGFRWLVQEDATFDVTPGESIPNAAQPDNYPLSMSFHTSYHPLARTSTPLEETCGHRSWAAKAPFLLENSQWPKIRH